MKLNKNEDKIEFTYKELVENFNHLDIEEKIEEFILEQAEYHYREDYCEWSILSNALEEMKKKYDFIEDIDLNGAYFEDYGYWGSSIWICDEDKLTINGATKEQWYVDLSEKCDKRIELLDDMFSDLKSEIETACFNYYDIKDDLRHDCIEVGKYTLDLYNMVIIENDSCMDILEVEYKDLSDNIKELIKEEQVEYTIIKTEYKLK